MKNQKNSISVFLLHRKIAMQFFASTKTKKTREIGKREQQKKKDDKKQQNVTKI